MNVTPGARNKRLMDMPLFMKIIDEAKTIPLINHVTITGLGETLLDRHLDDRLRYVRQTMPPGTLLDIYTNGSQLTLERGLRLAAAGIDVIYVSLNAVNKEKRYQIMKLNDYDKVAANTHLLIDKLKELESKTKVVVKAVVSKDLIEPDEYAHFMDEWGGPTDKGGNAYAHQEGNWAGIMYPMRTIPTKACGRALNEIMVLSDGRVSLCCFDSMGDVIFGDLNTQSIREIYNDGLALEYREAHVSGRRPELKLCSTCTII